MNISSKTNWFSIILPLLLFSGIGFFIYIMKIVLSKPGKSPIGFYLFIGIFIALLLTLVLSSIILNKKIKVTDNGITVHFLLNNKVLEYKNEQLNGFDETENYDKGGKYRSFSFRTSDGSVYLLSSREFRNFDELTNEIKSRTQQMEIGFRSNLKILSKVFMASMIITSLIMLVLNLIFEKGY